MEESSVPSKLYKYQPFDQYSLINLIKRQFYFSKPESFNDPYDCDPPFEISTAHRTKKNKEALYTRIKGWVHDKSSFDVTYSKNGKPNGRFERDYIDSTKPIREQISAKIGVTCFSERVDDILLWSHYGDKHKGFCLEFDTQVSIMDGQQKTDLYKVKYSNSRSYRRISILDILNKPNILEVLLTTKSYQWGYEKEWRIFCNTGGNNAFRFNAKSLTGVYFGYKMPQEYKGVIISVLSDTSEKITPENMSPSNLEALAKRYPHFHINDNIIVYDMKLDKENFTVSPVPFRPNNRMPNS